MPEMGSEHKLYKPVPTLGGVIGFAAFVVLVVILGGGLSFSLAESSALMKAMLMIPFLIFALFGFYVVLAFFAISYRIEDDGLYIRWGLMNKRIPWDSIRSIERIKGMPKVWPVFGANWPGYSAGAFTISGLGVMSVFGTELEDNLVVLRTGIGVFGVTPAEVAVFLELVQKKTSLIAQQVDLDEIQEALLQPVPSEDNIYLALAGLNFICVIGYVAYLAAFFPSKVSEALAKGVAAPPRELVLLAVIAVAMFFINISSARKVYQNMTAGGYMMWGIGIFITIFFASLSIYVISFS